VARNNITFFKRYSIDKVYTHKKGLLDQKWRANYDIVLDTEDTMFTHKDKIFYEAHVLKLCESIFMQFEEYKNFKIHINSTQILDLFFTECQIHISQRPKAYEILVHSYGNSNHIQKALVQNCECSQAQAKKLNNFMNMCGNFDDFKTLILEEKCFLRSALAHHIISHFTKLFEWCKDFEISSKRLVFDLKLVPRDLLYHSGLFFEVLSISFIIYKIIHWEEVKHKQRKQDYENIKKMQPSETTNPFKPTASPDKLTTLQKEMSQSPKLGKIKGEKKYISKAKSGTKPALEGFKRKAQKERNVLGRGGRYDNLINEYALDRKKRSIGIGGEFFIHKIMIHTITRRKPSKQSVLLLPEETCHNLACFIFNQLTSKGINVTFCYASQLSPQFDLNHIAIRVHIFNAEKVQLKFLFLNLLGQIEGFYIQE
jgi:histidyl-tRNA synthetase